jgi:metal-responsive CopG/Arc/MetJ family transcriptional regulator
VIKKPISITLSPEVLAALDKAAGNRSEYIEWLIRQDLKLGFKPIKKEVKK